MLLNALITGWFSCCSTHRLSVIPLSIASRRSAAVWNVQLRFVGGECSAGPPPAGDPQVRGRSLAGDGEGLRWYVCQDGPAIGATGTLAAGGSAADLLHGAQ